MWAVAEHWGHQFHRAQCDLILDALADEGLAEEEDGKSGSRAPTGRLNQVMSDCASARLDAFQGKEFDVVFLSVVRANDVVVPDQKEGKSANDCSTASMGTCGWQIA